MRLFSPPFYILKTVISKLLNSFNTNILSNNKEFTDVQKILKYQFKKIVYLKAALSHTSLTTPNTAATSFERMEFLGDSILGLIIAEELFHLYPDHTEGQLSKLKSKIVSKKYLALKAKEIGLGEHIILSSEAENSGGRDSNSILANTVESLICAIYLDGGYSPARTFITNIIFRDFQSKITSKTLIDYKSKLQEITQARFQETPDYQIVAEEGPEHEKIFSVEVFINKQKCGFGKGPNKKEAQQNAAREAIRSFSNQPA